MPLKLVPPREGKSQNWSIRGTYLGCYVDRSAKTDRRAVALAQLKKIEEAIERGEYGKEPAPTGPTFLSAALDYLKARPQKKKKARYVGRLIQYFGTKPLAEIDQHAIDKAALDMYPAVTPASRNSYVYTPMSAILHHAGRKDVVRRPKGALGREVTDYLTPEDAFAIIEAAKTFDREFALLLLFLLYTGVRLGEALALRPEDVRAREQTAWVRTSKNGKPRTLRLRKDLCAALERHQPRRPEKYFRFCQGGSFAHKLTRAKMIVLGFKCPTRHVKGWRQPVNRLQFCNFHTFCHTWATWMRQYGGADVQGLVATGRWSSIRAAKRYAHVVARDEWQRVDSLPGAKSVERHLKAV